MLLAPYVCYHILVKVTEWLPIGKIAAHSAYDMFSWYNNLIVDLVFFQPRFFEWESFSDCAFSCSLPMSQHRVGYVSHVNINRLKFELRHEKTIFLHF